MAEPRVSFIVPLWNGAPWIRACLVSLQATLAAADVPGQILVVDDGSTDDGPQMVAEAFPEVELLATPENRGFPGACNQGLHRARGAVVVLVNQDVEVDPGWLSALLEALADPGVGAAGGLALFPDRRTIQHAGGRVDWPLGLAHHLGYGEFPTPPWRRPADVDFVTGAGLALRREALDRVGLLDEGFAPGYYEDVDLCWRLREAGYSVRYVPDAILVHAEGSAFRDRLRTAWARLRGRLRFVLKHCPRSQVLQRFLPAERGYAPVATAGDVEGSVAQAYLEAVAMALECGWAGAPIQELLALGLGMHGLYLSTRARSRGLADTAWAEVSIHPVLMPSRLEGIPGVGGLWRRVRVALHRLVLFYVQRRELALAARVRELEARLALQDEQRTGHGP